MLGNNVYTEEHCRNLGKRAHEIGLSCGQISKILCAAGDTSAGRTAVNLILTGKRIEQKLPQKRARNIELIISEYERTEERLIAVLREEQTRR